jgi:hypothetical protein
VEDGAGRVNESGLLTNGLSVKIAKNCSSNIDGGGKCEVASHGAEESQGRLAPRIIVWNEMDPSEGFASVVKGGENDNI